MMTAPSNLVGSQPKCLEITKIFDLLIIIYYYYDKSILPQFILGLEVLADDGIKPSQSTGRLIFLISSFSHPIKYFIFMPFNNTCNISSLKHLINERINKCICISSMYSFFFLLMGHIIKSTHTPLLCMRKQVLDGYVNALPKVTIWIWFFWL